jgi:hypothetical protein
MNIDKKNEITAGNLLTFISRATFGKGARYAIASQDFFKMYTETFQKTQILGSCVIDPDGKKGLYYFGCGYKIPIYPDNNLKSGIKFFNASGRLVAKVGNPQEINEKNCENS